MPQQPATPVTRTAALPPHAAKAQFHGAYLREHAITRKILGVFPREQSEFRPHESSSSARQIAWTFVVEERMMLNAVKGEQVVGGGPAKPPETWDETVAAFDRQHEELVRRLEEMDDTAVGGTVQFFVGPKQMGDYSTMEFLWFLLCDQIHHRGQLSVYLRMTGGKVPSIYGPSRDEPWT